MKGRTSAIEPQNATAYSNQSKRAESEDKLSVFGHDKLYGKNVSNGFKSLSNQQKAMMNTNLEQSVGNMSHTSQQPHPSPPQFLRGITSMVSFKDTKYSGFRDGHNTAYEL